MAIRTIQTVVTIDEDRRLVLQLPADVSTGLHHIVAVIDETSESIPSTKGPTGQWTFPIIADAKWPADMPLTREEMYDDKCMTPTLSRLA